MGHYSNNNNNKQHKIVYWILSVRCWYLNRANWLLVYLFLPLSILRSFLINPHPYCVMVRAGYSSQNKEARITKAFFFFFLAGIERRSGI